VGGLASTAAAGVYAASSRLLALGAFALSAVITAISPQISGALAVRDQHRAEGLYQSSTWWLMIPSWPTYLVMAIFAPVLVRLFGTGFGSGAFVLALLSGAMLLSMSTGPVTTVLLMGGHSSWNLVNSSLGLALRIGLDLWLIPRYGLAGAAIGAALAISLIQIAAVLEVWFLMRLSPLGRGFAVVSLGSVASFALPGVLIRLVLGASVPALALCLLIGIPAYLYLLRRSAATLRFAMFREALQRRRGGRVTTEEAEEEVVAERTIAEA
jgi:O-antigen/teichoic acid export membrane protein